MTCLFCDTGKSFTTKEHIIPESLGNDDMILEKEVCDKCQNYLSQIENYVLSKTPIGFWRTLLTIKTKKNRLPFVDFTKKADGKGALPDFSEHHDNIKLEAHPDFTTELVIPKPLAHFLQNDNNGQLIYVLTPKVIHELGRLLGKIGIEIICHDNSEKARLDDFKSLRKYVREGSLKDLWPIFHTTDGDIKSLFEYLSTDTQIEEIVTCYSYNLLQIDQYVVFNFKVGIDSWFICLNQQFPHPDIINFMGNNVKAIWYSKKQWTK
jgi:HNH endonuclease